METLLASVIVGAIITILTQLSKHLGISNRIVLAVFVLIATAGYTAFQYFVDEVTRTQITNFAITAFGSAVILYEYLVRFFVDKTNQ